MNTFIEENKGIVKLMVLFAALFLIVATFGKLKEYRYIGAGTPATNTISVSGQGKVEKAPDTAKVSFSVRVEQKTLKAAQDQVSAKVDMIKKDLIFTSHRCKLEMLGNVFNWYPTTFFSPQFTLGTLNHCVRRIDENIE